MFDLTYAHCTSAVAGKPDAAPFTRYVFRTVKAQMYRVSPDKMLGETEDTFEVEAAGRRFYGDTKDDAAGEARYELMAASRAEAYRLAEESQATAAAVA